LTIWHIRIACWIPKATNILSVCVIFVAFPQKKIVARTRLNVTLYEGWNFNSGNYLFTTDTK